ncbi:hypothetical protein ACFL96_00210 [Thermoproteota archaeon]
MINRMLRNIGLQTYDRVRLCGSLRNCVSQYILPVTGFCNLRCLNCALCGNDKSSNNHIPDNVSLIKENRFFYYYPKKSLYHIVGGDPLTYEHTAFILAFLRAQGIVTVLWTNGVFPHFFIETILPFTDLFVLYSPAVTPEQYREITGKDGWLNWSETLDYLLGNKKKVVLNCPVTSDTVQFLPEIYEFAYKKKLILSLHYTAGKTVLSKESIAYINRFKRVKDVLVDERKLSRAHFCPAVNPNLIRLF